MKRIALILAGAAAFDLGVMAVAAQAQQGAQDPSSRSPGSASPGSTSGAAVQAPGGPGGTEDCTPRPGGAPRPCPPPAISDQAGQAERMGPPYKLTRTIEIKIDRVNTIQACTARKGQVVMHQGSKHCRLPAPAEPAAGAPRRD